MENLSYTEENYLKSIFKICEAGERAANTNAISAELSTSAASVSDMLKRLAGKQLIHYEKHRGVTLTSDGEREAKRLVRSHRLWEVFLVKTLQFSWDRVHEMAEQLEHVHSPELIERLDAFLGRPKFDPHGDPIPDAEGNFASRHQLLLTDLNVGQAGLLVGVQEHSPIFLQYLDRVGIRLGSTILVNELFEFDGSLQIKLDGQQNLLLSAKVCSNLFVQLAQ